MKVKVRQSDGQVVDVDLDSLPVVNPIPDSELDSFELQLLRMWERVSDAPRVRFVERPTELKTGYSAKVVCDCPDTELFLPAVFHARIDERTKRIRLRMRHACRISGDEGMFGGTNG